MRGKLSYACSIRGVFKKYPTLVHKEKNCVYLWVYTRGTQKVPGMVVLHCNGMTYGNAYLITFKVLPLGVHTLLPAVLPLLVTSLECRNWNDVELCRRFFSYRVSTKTLLGFKYL